MFTGKCPGCQNSEVVNAKLAQTITSVLICSDTSCYICYIYSLFCVTNSQAEIWSLNKKRFMEHNYIFVWEHNEGRL